MKIRLFFMSWFLKKKEKENLAQIYTHKNARSWKLKLCCNDCKISKRILSTSTQENMLHLTRVLLLNKCNCTRKEHTYL